jgi:hypothetical protein
VSTLVTNIVNISVYDLSNWLASGYSSIAVYTAASACDTYSEITVSGSTRIQIVSGTEYYAFEHTASGIADNTYKYKYVLSGTSSMTDFITNYFYGNSSDLTQMLRYSLGDTTEGGCTQRYSIKELRRFVKMGLWALQSTRYYKKFYADIDGIIYPRNDNRDRGIMLLSAILEANKSQLTKSADLNVSWSDGRGRFNNRTHDSLKTNVKMYYQELMDSIHSSNREFISPLIADMFTGWTITDEGWITLPD